jgi:hypothetical protein
MEKDTGRKIGRLFGVTAGFTAQSRQAAAQAIVMALHGESARLALEVAAFLEDNAAGAPKVGAKDDAPGMRKLRSQTPGRFGFTIPQRPSADFLGSTINSPPQPAAFFFSPT